MPRALDRPSKGVPPREDDCPNRPAARVVGPTAGSLESGFSVDPRPRIGRGQPRQLLRVTPNMPSGHGPANTQSPIGRQFFLRRDGRQVSSKATGISLEDRTGTGNILLWIKKNPTSLSGGRTLDIEGSTLNNSGRDVRSCQAFLAIRRRRAAAPTRPAPARRAGAGTGTA